MILNENLDAGQIDSQFPAVPPTFRGGRMQKRLLVPGHRLYKFTRSPASMLVRTGITPWWASEEPLAPGDPGFRGTLARSAVLGTEMNQMARARSAVTRESAPYANTMAALLKAELIAPVYGFVGQNSGQRVDEKIDEKVVFIGGAWQVWIPNLTARHIAQRPTT